MQKFQEAKKFPLQITKSVKKQIKNKIQDPRQKEISYLTKLINKTCQNNEKITILISGNTGCGKTYTVKKTLEKYQENKNFSQYYILSYALQNKIIQIRKKQKKHQIVVIDEIDAIYTEIGEQKTQNLINYYQKVSNVLILITNKFLLNLKNIDLHLTFSDYNQEQYQQIAQKINQMNQKLSDPQIQYLSSKITNLNQDVRKLINCVNILNSEDKVDMKDILSVVSDEQQQLSVNEALILNILKKDLKAQNLTQIKNQMEQQYDIQNLNIEKPINNLQNLNLVEVKDKKVYIKKDVVQQYQNQIDKILSEFF